MTKVGRLRRVLYFFFFNDAATTEIYTLSLHDALPISGHQVAETAQSAGTAQAGIDLDGVRDMFSHITHQDYQEAGSEEHTLELQSRQYLVCRLLLEKKKVILTYLHQIYSRRPCNGALA